MLMILVKLFLALLVICLGFVALCKILVFMIRFKQKDANCSSTVGFFHPYCNAGGGGERVLWCAIRSIQLRYPSALCVIYTGDCEATSEEILLKARTTFGITLPRKVKIVFLKYRVWVEAKKYPVLTLLGQSIGSILLGMEALLLNPPHVFLDTMGYAFTLPIFKYIGGCRIGCYVHYPTISTDMLRSVKGQIGAFNNRPVIAKSKFLTFAKVTYYRLFANLYGRAGRCAETVMVNSSWTHAHIESIWRNKDRILKVFPPCDIGGFLKLPLERKQSDSLLLMILSIGQFRPEKNHALQIKAFHCFLSKLPEKEKEHYILVVVGGCRNEGDKARVNSLKDLANTLGITSRIQFKTNIPFEELKDLLSEANVGIHTMANEHFGIGIVEFQAAGVIALAHNSGGPKMDIVQENEHLRTGFLANDITSYAEALHHIFQLSDIERTKIAEHARLSCKRFSEEEFEQGFLNGISPLFQNLKKTD